MKLKELIKVVYDQVVIYRQGDETGEYEDIYKGEGYQIPRNILEMEVGIIGAKRKGILDIEVRN